MSDGKLSVGEAIGFGWGKMKENLWFFVGVLLINYLISGVFNYLSTATQNDAPFLSLIISIVSWAVSLIIQIGMLMIAIKIADGKKAGFDDLYMHYKLFFPYFFVTLLYGLIVVGGLILLVIPGVIWAFMFVLSTYLVVDKGLNPIEALKKSAALTKGNRWTLFLLALALLGINILGALCLLIGLFATIPTSMVAFAHVYRKLAGTA